MSRRWICTLLDEQTGLVKDALEQGFFRYEDIANLWHIDGEIRRRDVTNWYLVNYTATEELISAGLIVLTNDYGTWWGCEDPDAFDLPDVLSV